VYQIEHIRNSRFHRQRATRDTVVEGILQDLIVVQGGPRTLGEHVHASFWKEDFSQWTLQDTRRVLGLNFLCIPYVSSSKMDVQEKEVMEEDEDDLQHNQAPDAMVGVETAVELVPTNLRIRKYCFERPIVTDRHAIASAWQQWQRGLDPEALCSSAPDSKRLIYTDPHTFQELNMLQRLLGSGYSHADISYFEGCLVAAGWDEELGVNSVSCIESLPRGCGGRWRSCCKNRVTVWHALQCSEVWDGAFHDEELMNDFLESVVSRLRRDGPRIWEDVRQS
jgi:hypothetical protein